ncbi:ABC transporter permease [Pseudooceanicola sp. CBS1P-1]|uniref:ABC transporter permease subunit n=1 Tax=Pseudooceanicola albus TaxID=2692189 RepID=A0A6L7G9T3_9RHOB|nr:MULTISPECIES: ABC transporter permease [Pseudooceanicola]MBT9386788.1 ABC transporter permease [Pseudooceanicola endophyticus]MXN20954.1 ABC transporter permease subunit [Pseudooceanicola albus]
MSARRHLAWGLASLLVLAMAIGLWSWIARAGLVSAVFLPGPERTWAAIVKGLQSGVLVQQTGQTLRRMVLGWGLASVLGIGAGAVIGLSARARVWVLPLLEGIRPLPASAVAPVAIVFLGLSEQMILVLIAFGALWPMLLTTAHGVASRPARLAEVSRCLGLSRTAYLRKIALPGALPDIFGGLRLGLTVALILAVVGEMITAQGGLGTRILLAARSFRAPDIFSGVVVLGLIGLASNAILSLAEAWLLRWRPR